MAAATFAIDLPDERATSALAAALAARARRGDVIALSGPLGSGKTSFARGFIRARLGTSPGAGQDVPSPTFALVEIYQPDSGPAIWHFDLYRLAMPDDAYELGIEDAFAEGVALIEWPERLGARLPTEHLGIALAAGPRATARVATLRPSPGWADRIAGLTRG
ncbi:MAG TPA: tRNA (adenosine(37)-N6)-threonylcarbamoyltransferase complex ATPase subunit type 1 TsaE [Stellaceae bacterium]|nr:tRNA (adenosine(37)-N6)-threonylcarbamoyltransferase complex ATPase subunit type 1 TsaE [Stellaceae bacterium]